MFSFHRRALSALLLEPLLPDFTSSGLLVESPLYSNTRMSGNGTDVLMVMVTLLLLAAAETMFFA